MMYWNGHMTTAGWIIAIVWTLIILALIAGGIAWLFRALGSRDFPDPGAPPEGSAREILDRRLAKGELTVEQYRQLRAALDDQPAGAGTAGEPPSGARPAGAPG